MEMDNDSGQSSHKRKLHQVLPGGSLKGTSSRKLVKMTSMSSAAAGHTSYTTTTTTSDNVASQLLLQEENQQQQQCHHHKKLQSSSSFTQTGKSTFTAIVGTTYEIDQKCLPPEAPHDIQCIRAVLVSMCRRRVERGSMSRNACTGTLLY
ncbi:unnamed protein product [Sphagnum troendelagicum]|uniref:Uncharacterized protein n=1 Tax=Sphagnum troendelagicum TaxID=128251 RepID=A0ABP0U8H2_9BRYO